MEAFPFLKLSTDDFAYCDTEYLANLHIPHVRFRHTMDEMLMKCCRECILVCFNVKWHLTLSKKSLDLDSFTRSWMSSRLPGYTFHTWCLSCWRQTTNRLWKAMYWTNELIYITKWFETCFGQICLWDDIEQKKLKLEGLGTSWSGISRLIPYQLWLKWNWKSTKEYLILSRNVGLVGFAFSCTNVR